MNPAPPVREVEVLVLGGGMSGAFAALAAREGGAAVVLVEPSNVLGGQGTAGGVAGFVGDTARVNDAFRELVARLEACDAIDPYRPNQDRRAYDLELCAFALQEMLDRRGVEIWLHARAIDAVRNGGTVEEVVVVCGPTTLRVRPRMVVDATGNAALAHMLGCRSVALGALRQLPMSLYFTLWDTGRPIRPVLPPGCPRWEKAEDLPMTSLHPFASGKIEVKMKVVGFDAADGPSLSRAEIHARRQMMGLVYHLQTRGYGGRHAANGGRPLDRYVLASVSRAIGQREGRRIVGRHTLTEQEIARGGIFDDAVAVGTYHFDFHWPDTDKRAGTGITTMVEPYHIPLRAMRPEALDNVLCPGRSLSGDQMALSSYRAMATCAQMGWGAGRAAGLALSEARGLDGLKPAALRAAIEADGQSLDLSRYGDYLRCLRLADERVASGTAGNAPAVLALARARDGVVLCRIEDGQAARVTMRREGAWHVAEQDMTAAPAVTVTGPTELAGPAVAVRTSEGQLAAVGHAPTGALLAFLSDDDGQSWNRRLQLSADADPGTPPAVLATPVGLAIAYRRRDGEIRYWEGAIERFGPLDGAPPDEASLQAMPYLDHLHLDHG